MKVCPECSESFADELKFCDLDGTKLTRHADESDQQGQNKLWSLLGIGLLVGALVLSAVSVFLIPKSRVAPPVASSPSQDGASSNKPASETASGAADTTVASATNEQPEIVVTEGPLPDAKKKEKAKALTTEDADSAALNPKAAAQGTENADKAAQPTETAPPPAPKKSEPAAVVKPVSETREAEAAPKPATSTDPKKDPKRADSSKDSDKKKADDKDKKKGGFFRVFKKIFGKD